jgi:hypothetical protein
MTGLHHLQHLAYPDWPRTASEDHLIVLARRSVSHTHSIAVALINRDMFDHHTLYSLHFTRGFRKYVGSVDYASYDLAVPV